MKKAQGVRRLFDKILLFFKQTVIRISDKVKARWTFSPNAIILLVIAGGILSVVIIASLLIFSSQVPAIKDVTGVTQGGPVIIATGPVTDRPVIQDNEVTKPVAFSVSSAVMAKKLGLNFEPQLVANSFPFETRPLYYFFIYNGSISDKKLEAQVYQKDKLHSSYQKRDFQYSSKTAWIAIDSILSPGDWLVRLYSDNTLVNIIRFSILSNVMAETSQTAEEKKQEAQPAGVTPAPQIDPVVSKAEEVGESIKVIEKKGFELIAELFHTQEQTQTGEDGHSGPPENFGKDGQAVTPTVANVAPRSQKTGSLPMSLAQKDGRLFVHPMPLNSRIRILNINPKYNYGIELPQGDYHLEISAAGHQTIKKWISINQSEKKHLSFELKPVEKQVAVLTGSGDSRLDSLLAMIASSDAEEMRTAAHILASTYYNNNFALNKAEQVLLANYQSSSNNRTSNDALAYLCKMLGASKQQRFRETLMTVGHHGNSFILMWHAQWSASALD